MVKVAFTETVDANVLKAFPGIETVNKLPGNEWELVCQSTNEVKKQLLEWSFQQNLNIVSLQSGEQRLEEVFRNLTNAGSEKENESL